MGVGVGCYALEVSQYLPVPGVVWFEFIKAILTLVLYLVLV